MRTYLLLFALLLVVVIPTAARAQFQGVTQYGPITAGNCVTWKSTNIIQDSGVPCGGGHIVASVSNTDGTLTISPTTGAVVANLNLAEANDWNPPGPNWASPTNYYFGVLFQIGSTAKSVFLDGANSNAALIGAIEVPSTATAATYQNDGVQGFAKTDANVPAVGGFFVGMTACNSSSFNCSGWGDNLEATNGTSVIPPSQSGSDFDLLYGSEVDLLVKYKTGSVTPAGRAIGVSINAGGSEVVPTSGAIGLDITAYSDGSLGYACAICLEASANTNGIVIKEAGNGASSVTSQTIEFQSLNSGGSALNATLKEDILGNLISSAPVEVANGSSCTALGLFFAGATNTGFVWDSTPRLSICSGGNQNFAVATSSISFRQTMSSFTSGGPAIAAAATAGTPSFTPANTDAKAGVGDAAAGDVSIYSDVSSSTKEMARFDTSGNITMYGPITNASLATVGTIAGSICATSAGLILYESGATGCTISLRMLKQDIRPLSYDVAERDVESLRPLSFAYRSRPDVERIGFVAEDTLDADPRFATYDGRGDLQAYDPNAVLSVTVAVVQHMSQEIKSLRRQVAELQRESEYQ